MTAFLKSWGTRGTIWLQGALRWPDLTPPEYAPLDELAHEEVPAVRRLHAF